MVKSCCAYGCTKRFNKNSSVSFHSFPTNPEMRRKWIKSIKRENFIPSKGAVVCSEHFLSTDFLCLIGSRRLRKDAVPTVFNFPGHLIKKPISRRLIQKTSLRENIVNKFSRISEKLSLMSKEFSESKPVLDVDILPPTSGRKRTFGDFKEEDLLDSEKMKLMWQIAKETISSKNKKIRYLQQKGRRQLQKIRTLKNLLNQLKGTDNFYGN